jgi:hypothetical protein
LTNRIAFWLALVLLAAGLADWQLNDGAGLLFLARRFLGLIEVVAFWR